jgi:DNA-binding transcriptional MerR regulator
VIRMPVTFTIGEFSRLTHLPVKTLHHYHEVGVLVPAVVDPATGYRRYSPDQVDAAHLVRRLRDTRMPPAEIRAVLAADEPGRTAGIAAHLDRLHRELTETATAVASLRALMEPAPPGSGVRIRDFPALDVLAVEGVVGRAEISAFCADAYPRLFAALGAAHAQPAGPGAALYPTGWFESDGGRVVTYLPIDAPPGPAPSGVRRFTVPGGPHAVSLHLGPFDGLDVTYGRLGRHVLSEGLAAEGPIRENYLVTPADTTDPDQLRTEVCWPVTTSEEP